MDKFSSVLTDEEVFEALRNRMEGIEPNMYDLQQVRLLAKMKRSTPKCSTEAEKLMWAIKRVAREAREAEAFNAKAPEWEWA